MSKEILADVDRDQIRIGVLEDRQLVEYYVERTNDQRVVGNIYKGKVTNVLPGIQAAFVDIGLGKNAFLFAGDLNSGNQNLDDANGFEDLTKISIKDFLHVGQEVLVQVVKEPMGTKGARVSMNITLPGRYLVLMPMVDYIGISRRIESEVERQRLKALAQEICPPHMGVIVRTVAEGKGFEELKADMEYLKRLWDSILKKQKKCKAPRLIYKDMDLLSRIVRDVFTPEVSKFYVNTSYGYEKVRELASCISPSLQDRVNLYMGEEDIFEYFNIESEAQRALERKVWLKSGGYIVIDNTEALTAIDVNTGKFVGSIDLEDTVVKTNLEAAREIAKQLRLRDIGGIIIIDFIDMNSQEHQKMIIETLEAELKKDRTKAHVLGITNLGLVEMTRKKVRQSLYEVLEKVCPYCEGRGRILSEDIMAKRVEREISRIFRTRNGEAVLIEVNPSVAAVVIGAGGSKLSQLEQRYGKYIFIKGKDDLHPEEIRVKAVGSKAKLEHFAMPVREGQILDIIIEEAHVANPRNGIARVDGYVIDVEEGADYLGLKVKVQISKTYRTYAKARLI
ncbi:MAG TPA: Rne/Rng family ribonuclease [Thermoanaerobacterales bacterium]|uniref:Rne/Rng family ribonuclease n=1 Tax=Tepidanaerobacter sp. GT38 TaxID=2722793 RepID=UPI0017E2D6DB|nr:Rne/Rng family ribonuclease [Tepidanaerobacter sp. GT38]MCG1012776.1 Rne/Rng family ribonuclease [Tepidanaerobacter sp. GT38]HHY41870.1 Rne/Rng family ribonuclease [Thermoanaerobacterales bacterium]